MPKSEKKKNENAKRSVNLSAKRKNGQKVVNNEEIEQKYTAEDFQFLFDAENNANAFTPFYCDEPDEDEDAKPADSEVQRLLNEYEHQSAIDFAAYTKIWNSERKPKPPKLSRGHKPRKVETRFLDSKVLHAYYRVIAEREDSYILMACHVNVHGHHRGDLRFVEVDDRTISAGNEDASVVGKLFLGDIVAVTNLIRTSNTPLNPPAVVDVQHQSKCVWSVLTMTILPRTKRTGINFAVLDNGTAVVQGHDESMTILTNGRQLEADTIYKGDAFVPDKVEFGFCRNNHTRHKNSLIAESSVFQSYPNALGTIYKLKDNPEATRMFEIGVDAFKLHSESHPEQIVETCALMGYSAANTVFNGRSDSRTFPMKNIQKLGLIVKFSIANPKKQPTNGRWVNNMRIKMDGRCGKVVATIETAILEADEKQLRIVARISRGSPKHIDFEDGVYVVAQREFAETPLLRKGFFDTMPNGSNGKRIIETLYGGDPMTLNAPINVRSFQFPSQPVVNLNEFQNEYVSMLLAGTPMVIASAPFGCGKSMTIVTAVLEKKKEEPSKQQLLVTQSNYAGVNLVEIADRIQKDRRIKLLRFVSEKNWKELPDECHTDYDMPCLIDGEFVKWAMDECNHLTSLSFHDMSTIVRYVIVQQLVQPMKLEGSALFVYARLNVKQRTTKPRSKDLLEAFFVLYQPDVVVTTADSLQGLMSLGVLDTISTIQIDEASQVPEYIILNLLSSYPNANFGLIGDTHQLPPYCEGELKGKLKDYGIGNTMERVVKEKLFPRAIFKYVYRCHPKTTHLLSELFYDGDLISGVTEDQRNEFIKERKDVWPNPNFPMIIVDNQEPGYKMGTSCGNKAEVTLVKRIVEHITKDKHGYGILPEGVGVISFYSAQTAILTEAMRGSGVKCGTVDAFQGSEREVMVVCATNEKLSEFMQLSNRLNVALSRARQATILIGNVDGMRAANFWCKIVECTERHGCLMDTTKFPFSKSIVSNEFNFPGLSYSLNVNCMAIKEKRRREKRTPKNEKLY